MTSCCHLGLDNEPWRRPTLPAADRIRGRKARARQRGGKAASRHDGWLTRLSVQGDGQIGYPLGQRASHKGLLEMTLDKHLRIADWTGRQERRDKHGAIPAEVAPILERLHLQEKARVASQRNFNGLFKTAIGKPGKPPAQGPRARPALAARDARDARLPRGLFPAAGRPPGPRYDVTESARHPRLAFAPLGRVTSRSTSARIVAP